MHTDELEQKQHLVEAAIEVYLEDSAGFTMSQVAKRVEMERSELYKLFHSRKAMLRYYYYLCVLRYEMMAAEIEDFEKLDLSEKFANFVYTLFDLFGEEREFVEETFEPLIFNGAGKSLFLRRVEAVFAGFLARSPAPSMTEYAVPLLSRQYLLLVRHWLDDDSEGAEETLALADKTIAFGAEALESRLLTKGLDLAKYLVGSSAANIDLDAWWRRFKDGCR